MYVYNSGYLHYMYMYTRVCPECIYIVYIDTITKSMSLQNNLKKFLSVQNNFKIFLADQVSFDTCHSFHTVSLAAMFYTRLL